MLPPRLQAGDLIGIVSPSHLAERERYAGIFDILQRRGFRVKEGKNLYGATDGYMASAQERADDFNAMVADPAVKMVFFGGGENGCEVVPLLDYDLIRRHPKLLLSYSDGTTILATVHAQTGLTTYYGQAPGTFSDLRAYDWDQFTAHIMQGHVQKHVSNAPWRIQTQGVGEGRLMGGYSHNFAFLLGSPYFRYDPKDKHLLFLEDHEKFGEVSRMSAMLSMIEQSPFMQTVTGLLYGHFSLNEQPDLYARIRRFGEMHNIPTAYCDDFGHGKNHAIFPYGALARLDTRGAGELLYL